MDARNRSIAGPMAILGWGASGKGAASLAKRQGIEYEVFDEGNDMSAKRVFTANDARRYRTVVYSPGFKYEHRWLQRAHPNPGKKYRS